MFSVLRSKAPVQSSFAQALLESTPDAVFLIQEGRITQCNDATMQVYGYPREAIIGKGPDFFSTEFQPCGTPSAQLVPLYLEQALKNGHHRFTWTNRHSTGKELPLVVTLIATMVDGVPSVLVNAQDHSQTDAMIRDISRVLAALAEGDLTCEAERAFEPEYEVIRGSLNAAIRSMRQLIEAVSGGVVAIRTGSGEIAHASEDLARRTEAGAASLEETAAAITLMDSRLKATADAGSRTVQQANGAISTVNAGRTTAEQAVRAMDCVAEGAKGIDSVIEGLDKIAFQTRVLAMNAAVEAGRAGEAGRGFAVVADLVSALAMRSEEEAARAREQLTTTQADIVQAVGMVQNVDKALENISVDVTGVHALLEQMTVDNHAQAQSIGEISAAIGSMDRATQQNAAMVEETSAAARTLSSEVNVLAEQASRFKTGTRSSRPGVAVREGAVAKSAHYALH